MRLVVPSWLVPGGWLENVGVAAGLGWATGIELLFFSFEGKDRELFLSEREGIIDAAARGGLSLSVHLPDPLLPAHCELVDILAPAAECFIVHPPREDHVEVWRALLSVLRRRHGDRFLLEYTGAGAFAAAEEALPGLPLCADTGRLLVEGIVPAAWIAQRADRIREVHLHGVEEGGEGMAVRDHRVFTGREAWFSALLPFLSGWSGRVELEVFSLAKVEAARAALKELA